MILRNLKNRKRKVAESYFEPGIDSAVNSGITAEANYAITYQHYGHHTFRKGNRTYLVYMQRDENPWYMMPTITYWDHDLKVWAEPVELIIIQPGSTDYHPVPVVMLDNDGYIYVAVERLHNSSFYIHKSVNPYDITSWNFSHGITSQGGNAYPCIYHDPQTNNLFLIGRRLFNITSMYRSTDGGDNWTLVANVGTIGSGSEERSYHAKPLGVQNSKREIHFLVQRRVAGEIFTDTFYCKCSMDTPHIIQNYDGSYSKNVSTSGAITLAEYRANYAMGITSANDTQNVDLAIFHCLSPNGILFYQYRNPATTEVQTCTRNSDNTAWIHKPFVMPSGFSRRTIISYDDDTYDVWIANITTGEFQRLRTKDRGDTYETVETFSRANPAAKTQFTSNFNDGFNEGVFVMLTKNTNNWGTLESIEYTK